MINPRFIIYIKYIFHSLLIADETPEIHLQIVRIHLDLLQAKFTKSAQAHALQQRLSRKQTQIINKPTELEAKHTLSPILMMPMTMEALVNSTEVKMSTRSENKRCILDT